MAVMQRQRNGAGNKTDDFRPPLAVVPGRSMSSTNATMLDAADHGLNASLVPPTPDPIFIPDNKHIVIPLL